LRDHDRHPVDFVQNWKECIDHLWKYASKPMGIAHTDVLKENFFAVIVALHVKPTMPLLITGPAGILTLSVTRHRLRNPRHFVCFFSLFVRLWQNSLFQVGLRKFGGGFKQS